MTSSSVQASGNPVMSRRWRRIAAGSVISIVALIGVAAILLLTIDFGRFKDSIADSASTALGRKLHIDGELSIRIGRTVRIAATDMVIANAEWAGDEPLLRVGSLAAELEAASILFGPLYFKRIELAGVSAQLVENDARETNWRLGVSTEAEIVEPETSPEFPLVLEQVAITDLSASISSPELTAPLDVRIAILEHSIEDGRYVNRIDGTVNNVPLVVQGNLGPRSSVLHGGPATFDYDGWLGEIDFDAEGSFDDIHAPREPLVEFSLRGPSAQYLFNILNLREASVGELELRGRLGRAASRIEFGVHGKVGEFVFEADGWTSDLATLADGELTLDASGPNVDRVASVFGIDQLPPEAFRVSGAFGKAGTRLNVDSLQLAVGGSELELHGRLPRFPELAGTELAFTASGTDLAQFADLPSLPYSTSGKASYTDDRVRLAKTAVTLGEARASIEGDIEPAGRDTRLNLAVESSVPDLAAFLSGVGVNGAPSLAAEIAARIEHGGGETRIADIDGHVGDAEITGSLALVNKGEQLTAAFKAGLRVPQLDAIVPRTTAFAAAPVAVDLQSSGAYTDGQLELASLTATAGDASVAVQGSIADVREISGLDLRVQADVPDLAALGRSERFAIPALPLDVEGRITGARGAWSANDVLAVLGNSRFEANLRYARGDIPDIDITARAARLDLRDVLPEPGSRTAESKAADGRVIPDTRFPVDLLARMNVTTDIEIGELLMHRLDLRDVVIDGRIRDGVLHVDTLDVRGARGHVVGEVDYRPVGGTWTLVGSLQGDNLVLARPDEPEDVVQARPTYQLEAQFSGQGTGLRELLATLDGRTLMHGGKGLAPNTGGFLGDLFFGDFTAQLLDTVNPFTRTEKTTKVRCAVLMLDFDDGVVSGDPAVVIQTEKLNIFGRGTVNLGTEALKISINTAARKGIGIGFSDIVTPYTIVRGTLASPTLSLSEKDVLFQGGAAVATGGLTIIARSLKNRFLSDKKPCETALETYRKAAETPR